MADDALTIDLQDLTVEEVELIEDLMDLPMEDLFKPGQKRGRLLRVIAFIVKRREDPDFTMEDAGKLKVSFGAPSEALDPTEASAP